MLLADVAQRGVTHDGAGRLAGQWHEARGLRGGHAQAHGFGGAQYQVLRHQAADEHGADHGHGLAHAFLGMGVEAVDLVGQQAELGADARDEAGEQCGVHRPVQPRHRQGAGHARGQRTPVQQAARAQHRGAQVLGHLGLGGARGADAAQGAGEHGQFFLPLIRPQRNSSTMAPTTEAMKPAGAPGGYQPRPAPT